jgi:hypothetical protein
MNTLVGLTTFILTVLLLLVKGRPSKTMKRQPKPTAALLAEIEQLKAALGEIGIVLRGSVTERYMPCGRTGCRCQATPPRLHGPYFQWTTKVEGKTKTVRLGAEEVPLYREWIANGRKLDQIIRDWEQTGLAAADLIREK